MPAVTGQGRIVVGVDGSMGAIAAMRWAAHEAVRRDATLHIVLAVGGHQEGPRSAHPAGEPEQELELTARYALGPEPWPMPVVRTVLRGRPGPLLAEVAADADLLVVGTRGRGTTSGLLLGSVSQYCARHAVCPVVIVPPSARLEAERVAALPLGGVTGE